MPFRSTIPNCNSTARRSAASPASLTSQMTLDLTLSNNAVFEVYGRPDGTGPIGNTLNLSFGANYYYLKVIADDPAISRFFPITIWRGESDALPAAPVIALQDQGTGQPVENGGFVRNPVKAAVISSQSFVKTVAFNGAPANWPADGIFSQAGLYQVNVAGTDGQTASAGFTIDLTAPEIKATANGALLAQNAHTRYSVLLSATDANLAAKTLKKNNVDIAWPENNFINSDGNYTVIATDKAGNTASFPLTIDKTLPTVAAKTSTGVALANGAISKYSVTLLASDRNLKNGILKKNNVTIAWPSDNIINSDGVYTIAAIDCAGNTSAALSLTIDKTKPAITAKTSAGTVLANGAHSKYNVTLLVSDRNFKTKSLKKEQRHHCLA